jgi:hypothetical protein
MQIIRDWYTEDSIYKQAISTDVKFIFVDEDSMLSPLHAKLEIGFTKPEYSTYSLDSVHGKIGGKFILEYVQDLFSGTILVPESITENREQILNLIEQSGMGKYYGYDALGGKFTGILEVVYDYLNNLFSLHLMEDSRPEIFQIKITIL